MKTMQVEVWVAVNDSEEYGVGIDSDEALEDLGGAVRLVKVVMTIPVPAPVVVTVDVGPEPAGVTATVTG